MFIVLHFQLSISRFDSFQNKNGGVGSVPRGSGDLGGLAVTDLGSFNASLPSTYAGSAQTAFVTTSPSLPRHQENVLSHLPLVRGLPLGALQSRFFSR